MGYTVGGGSTKVVFVGTSAAPNASGEAKVDANTFDVPGTFTIRGVSKPETLTFTTTGKGTGVGELKGTMAFDRKQFGMNSGIPFIKIADRVEVIVDIKGKRVSGPPPAFKE